MHARVSPRGGPRPWRTPRTGPERLLLAAWLQLGLLVACATQLVLFAWLVLPGADAVACFDGTEAACGTPDPSVWSYALPGTACAFVLVVAALAVAIARRHRRGAASRLAAIAAVALPAAVLAAIAGAFAVAA
jgi:hypothetical protein